MLTLALAAGGVMADTSSAATPVLKITSPRNGSATNDATPVIRGTDAYDPYISGFAPVKVTIMHDSERVAELQPEAGATWATTVTQPLAPGAYKVTAVAELGEEETEKEEDEVTFSVDQTPPHVTLTAPANGTMTSSSEVTAAGLAGVEAGDAGEVAAQLFSGSTVAGEPVEQLKTKTSGDTWSATFGGLGPGTYTVRAVQIDEAGNEGVSAPSTFTVISPPITPHPPPSASFTWFPASPHPGEQLTLVSTSTDASAPITSLAWSVGTVEHFLPGSQLLTTSFPSVGSYLVRLRVVDSLGGSSAVSHTVQVTSAPLPLMQPFPVVRIVGRLTESGAHISLLSVQAPVDARVTVTCRGRGCPARSISHVAAAPKHERASGAVLLTFPHLARTLYAGAVLAVRVTKAGEIGKYTRFLIRRRLLPERTDACLWPSSAKPASCPA